jgi:hypothetical protein
MLERWDKEKEKKRKKESEMGTFIEIELISNTDRQCQERGLVAGDPS